MAIIEADSGMSASIINVGTFRLDERRFEEKIVFGESGKTETVKVNKWFFSHKEFFADSSA